MKMMKLHHHHHYRHYRHHHHHHYIHHDHLAGVAANSAIVHVRHSKIATNFAIRDRLVSHLMMIVVVVKTFL